MDHAKVYEADDGTSLQESDAKKARWLEAAQTQLPIGSRVRVVDSDEARYVGRTGSIDGYDLGHDGEWPLIGVQLDDGEHDGFYDDQIALVADHR